MHLDVIRMSLFQKERKIPTSNNTGSSGTSMEICSVLVSVITLNHGVSDHPLNLHPHTGEVQPDSYRLSTFYLWY